MGKYFYTKIGLKKTSNTKNVIRLFNNNKYQNSLFLDIVARYSNRKRIPVKKQFFPSVGWWYIYIDDPNGEILHESGKFRDLTIGRMIAMLDPYHKLKLKFGLPDVYKLWEKQKEALKFQQEALKENEKLDRIDRTLETVKETTVDTAKDVAKLTISGTSLLLAATILYFLIGGSNK